MASVRSIAVASIHRALTRRSSSGPQIVARNSRHVIVSASGIFRATRFSAGTPRTRA
jgi:hypothetical protein